jgi:hypothetical protein
MHSDSRLIRLAAGLAISGAIVTTLASCSGGESTTPSTTTTPSSSTTTPPSPTEKAIDPTGGNKFSPTVVAPAPFTPLPGNVPGDN